MLMFDFPSLPSFSFRKKLVSLLLYIVMNTVSIASKLCKQNDFCSKRSHSESILNQSMKPSTINDENIN